MPTAGQLALLIASAALFAAGVVVPRHPLIAKSARYWGALAAVGVLVWHSLTRGSWLPVGDNFDALIWLAVLVAAFLIYVQARRPLAALDWVLTPVVIGLLVAAAVFGRMKFHPYVGRTWTWTHRTTSYGGAALFAVAAAGGVLYVVASNRLRRKQLTGSSLGSLERLERLNVTAVTFGFALLTVGIITGAFEMFRQNKSTSPWKVGLAVAVWLVYAVVLHAPINPVWRGRRAALLSVLGFVLMMGTLAAVQLGGGR